MGIPEIRRVAVMGAGSWGTAFAKLCADAGRSVSHSSESGRCRWHERAVYGSSASCGVRR